MQDAARSYSLVVSVDEVDLTFHATDVHGLPVNDLKLDELKLLDNGKPPSRIVAFQPLRDFPIRAGILMDTSVSVAEYLPRNRAIAAEYAARLMRQKSRSDIRHEFRCCITDRTAMDERQNPAGCRSAKRPIQYMEPDGWHGGHR